MTQFFIEGTPVPQGSKNAYVRGGRAVLVETSKKLPAWRAAVTQAAQATGITHPKGRPVTVTCEFVMPRTQAMRNRQAPPMVQKPDVDKLLRAVGDGLTASGMIHDDSHIVEIRGVKRRAEPGEKTGCWATVAPYSPQARQSHQHENPIASNGF